MAAPEVSVIVPVRNGARSLPALLESLAIQTLERERFEVIVVDNASRDATAAIAREHGATVVDEPRPSRSRARNRGAAAARAPRYAFTDADCVADRRWLEELLSARGRAPLVAGDVRVLTAGDPNAVERFETLWRFGQAAWVLQGWAATANLLVDAGAFDAVGGFDPAWRHIAEDADFCLRAGRAGYRLTFCAEAVIEHRAERRLPAMLRRCVLHGYSSNQAHYRIGVGTRAWTRPGLALHGDLALRELGHEPQDFLPEEWQRMARLARLAHAARVAGSLWAEVERAR